MDGMVNLIPANYIYTVAGILCSGFVALTAFVGKVAVSKFTNMVKSSQQNQADTLAQLQNLNTELTIQRTNCLSTIQDNGKRQLDTLQQIAESVSYLRGKSDVN